MRHKMPDDISSWNRFICMLFGHTDPVLRIKEAGGLTLACMRCEQDIIN